MNLLAKASVLVAALAIAIGAYLSSISRQYLPWHQGPLWERFLNAYDVVTEPMYKDCRNHTVSTSFGSTFAYDCGSPQNPPVFMFHGAGSSTFMYGDWLMTPPLLEHYRAFAADYPCDTGRSHPPDLDPTKCPQTQADIAQWVYELVTHPSLGVDKEVPVAVLGYSYGAFVSIVAAEKYPQRINQIIAIAPAAVFAPIKIGWLLRALLHAVTKSQWGYNWFLRYMSCDPNFDLNLALTPPQLEVTLAAMEVGAVVLGGNPDEFALERLSAMAQTQTTTALLIGQNETVVNATRALQHAQTSGWQTRLYPNAGHLMLLETGAREAIAEDVVDLLGCNDEKQNEEAVAEEYGQ